jgi:parvulin-like peptidyl-prolyl isomerase
MKKKTMISLALAALLVTGCGKVAELENGEDIVASFDGKNITANNLYDEVKAKYARNVLIDMIDKTILDKKYKTTNAMKENVQSTVDYYKEQLGDNFSSYIKSQLGLNSEEELFNYLLLDYKRNEATKDYLADTITDKEINDYYAAETVGDIKASHILIKPETTDSMTDEQVTAAENKAKKEAEDIITKLNSGEKFSDLLKSIQMMVVLQMVEI